jgi:hypothetical protein
MATESRNNFSTLSQTPPGALTAFVRNFRSYDPCRDAADVQTQAARTRAFRAQVWPLQRPVAPPDPDPTPAPAPAPETPAPAVLVLPALSTAVPGRITVRRVLEVTAAHFGIAVSDLTSGRRTQPLVRRRHIAMYVARRMTGRSLLFIASHMGYRDHTTILHGVRAVTALLDAGDGATIAAVNQIVASLPVANAAENFEAAIEEVEEAAAA